MGAVATVILAAPLLPTEQWSPGFRWNLGMGRVSAATTIDQLLFKPCIDALPSPLDDGGKGDSWLVLWGVFLWQHPRVPWVCSHLGSRCRWGGGWWLFSLTSSLLPYAEIRQVPAHRNIHTGWVFHFHRWQCCVPNSWRIYWFLV